MGNRSWTNRLLGLLSTQCAQLENPFVAKRRKSDVGLKNLNLLEIFKSQF